MRQRTRITSVKVTHCNGRNNMIVSKRTIMETVHIAPEKLDDFIISILLTEPNIKWLEDKLNNVY